MRHVICIAVAVANLTLGHVTSSSAQSPHGDGALREWTDRSGKFKVQAEFLRLIDDKVQLRKNDGSVITVPVDRLAQSDQDFLRQTNSKKERPAPKASRNPKNLASTIGSIEDYKLPQVDDSKVTIFSEPKKKEREAADKIPPPWNVTPDPERTAPKLDRVPAPLTLASWPNASGNRVIELRVTAMAFRPDTTEVLLAREFNVAGKNRMGIERCDIAKGKSLGILPLPAGISKVAISSVVNRVLTWSDERLDVWDLLDKELAHVTGYQHQRRELGLRIRNASFVDDNRIIIFTDGAATFWNVARSRTEFILNFIDSPHWALSANARLLAAARPARHKLSIFDTKNGRLLGERPLPILFAPFLSFSPSGNKLLALDDQEVFLFDVNGGKTLHEFSTNCSLSDLRGVQTMVWPSNDLVLTDGWRLLDPHKGLVIRSYKQPFVSGVMGAGYYWYAHTDSNEPLTLVAMTMPPANDLQQGGSNRSRNVLEPGAKIALRLEGDVSPEIVTEFRSAAQSRLKESGFEEVGDSPLVLRIKIASVPHNPQYELTKFEVVYSLQERGEEVWRLASTVVWFIAMRVRQDTLAECIARQQQADVRLPKFLTLTEGGVGSELTAQGVK